MKRKLTVFSISLLALVVFSFFAPVGRYFEIAKNMEIFASAFREITLLYVEEVNPNELIEQGIDAMLESLDPYTNFIPEDEVENYRTLNTGQYGGIGATTQTIGKRTLVTMIYEGYPAAKNGLKIGDEIMKIRDVELSKVSSKEAIQLMRGQVGTPIHLTIKRIGEPNPLQLNFIRQKIEIDNVPYYGMVNNNTGYIQLSNFTSKASKEVKNATVNLKKKGAKSIILDLRGNPGGLLLEAVNICGLFLPKGINIVTTKGKRSSSNASYKTREEPVDTTIPLAVLIDKKSASASEIVAGSLQDYDRAVVMGEKSFGKGLVQLNRPLPYNAQFRVTTAKYYTPTGRCIQALDYSNKQKDGSIGNFPDSLKKEFKTLHGRSVYDGGGVSPDIAFEFPQPSFFAQTLDRQGFIIDYATQYAVNHATIVSAKEFSLEEKEYDEFRTWMQDKKYIYTSPVAKELDILKAIAEKEYRFDELAPLHEQLVEKINKSTQEQLSVYKSEIKKMLEKEIASHYYFEKGITEVRLRYDSIIAQSTTLLRDPIAYKKTLNTL